MTRSSLNNQDTAFLQSIIDSAPVAIMTLDGDGIVMSWNRAAERMFGWSAEEVIGGFNPIVPESHLGEFRELRRRVREEGAFTGVEVQRRHKSGATVEIRLSTAPIRDQRGRLTGILAFLEDIGESRRYERELALARHRIEAAFAAATVGIATAGLDGEILIANRAMSRLLGGDEAEELVGRNILDITHPGDRARNRQLIAELIAGQRERYVIEKRYVRHDREPAWVRASVGLSRTPEGEPEHLVGVVEDLTEERRNKRALVRQAEIIDQARDAIVMHDLGGTVRFWNRGAEQLFGWSRKEALGRSIRELMREDAGQFERAAAATEKTGHWQGQLQAANREGRMLLIDSRWSRVDAEGDEGSGILTIGTDVTDTAKLEDQLRESQRLEAVGQLTGGVAHDFNNLLTVVIGNAELMSEELGDQPDLLDMTQMILDASRRGAEMTRRLLAFARQQPLTPEAVALPERLDNLQSLLRQAIGEHIELRITHPADPWPAYVDASQLEAAVLNLALNARDAMPEGGQLIIETDNVRLDEEYTAAFSDLEPGEFVMIAVSDSGTGIPQEQLNLVFEPFFTTKQKGQGTGLGLSMVQGFLKQSSGHIQVYSELGEGTTVRLYLPRAGGPAQPVPASAESGQSAGGSESILLVEDNDLVLRYSQAALVKLGYRVLAARDGQEALQILEQGETVDLLFTDVIMPGGLNGPALARKARQLRPGMRVLFTSGYTENAIIHHGRLDPGVQLLQKPYQTKELARKIREVLS